MAFGATIKFLREDASISVQKIADKIGVDPVRWRKWESKDLNPRHEDVIKIEKFFNRTLDEILELKSIKKFLNVPHETRNGILHVKSDVEKELGLLTERVIKSEASVTVLSVTLAELLAKASKKSIGQVVVELSKAIDAEADRLFDELKKRSESSS